MTMMVWWCQTQTPTTTTPKCVDLEAKAEAKHQLEMQGGCCVAIDLQIALATLTTKG